MYSNYVMKNAKTRRAQPAAPVLVWTAGTVWAAAAYAHRINGEYIKNSVTTEDGKTQTDNRTLMQRALTNTELIAAEDIALGQAARDYHTRTLLFAALQRPLTEFQATLSRACGLDEVSERDRYSLAVICSQISGYYRAQEQDSVRQLVDLAAPAVGTVGTKIQANITVIRSNYSIKYGVYFVNAVTDLGQPVFFSYRENLATASQHRVSGTVKALRSDATQLNRVKIIQENA